MSGIIKATNIGTEDGIYSVPTRYISRRLIQRTSYTHRVGWWRGNNTYFWVPGAYIDFRPRRSDSRIKVSFMIPTRAYGSAHMISHWIFYRDEVEYGRHSRGGHNVENPFVQEWDIASWGAGQYSRLGYKFRSYTEANHNAHLYLTNYWDGTAQSLHIQGQVIVEEYIPPYEGYQLQVFGRPGSYLWTVPTGVISVDALVVGGGGGGGFDMGGGGGAGGVIYSQSYSVTPGATYNVFVGSGGWGAPEGNGGIRGDGVGPQPNVHQFTIGATNGVDSRFDTLIAKGGGAGGSSVWAFTPGGRGSNGGSGGGASGYDGTSGQGGGLGTAEQGFRGGNNAGNYYSGGGGGAGGQGTDGPAQANGGPGIPNSILGPTYYWGGGGGGAAYTLGTGGFGGLGGGGGGAVGTTFGGIGGITNGQPGAGGSPNAQTNTRGGDAGPGTGGGGGGGSHYNFFNRGGDGGHGIVILRWRPPNSN